MARPPKERRESKSVAPGSPPKDEEESLLGEFLSGFELDEVSFDQWVECESSLDLVIDTKVDKSLLDGKSSVNVKYTRLVNRKKLKMSVTVSIPKNCPNGEEFRFPERGDEEGSRKGDLIVKVRTE